MSHLLMEHGRRGICMFICRFLALVLQGRERSVSYSLTDPDPPLSQTRFSKTMAVISLPLTLNNSFRSQDYCTGPKVIFKKIERHVHSARTRDQFLTDELLSRVRPLLRMMK